MGIAPYDRKYGQKITTDVAKLSIDRAFLAHFQVSAANAVVAAAAAVHAAIACSAGATTTVTTAITNPGCPKNITATAGGTATDIKAVQVTITGTNYADEVITEVLPVFTVDTAGTVVGNKAFKTITSISIPAMDGAGATVAIGFGVKLGLPFKLPHNTVRDAYLNNVKEVTPPTVVTSSTAIESNTFQLASALNGSVVDIYLIV
jgi:hypothetical protein